ncbi:hypothetical protein KUM39_06015 [Streptomyces sp. J2-1]|uniref:hypothetical protein n=1 Tax=Streptomyces corallincola TaxID=2851888 RepID=UPI001C3846E5|nr:hypothetical protein [Streptomyces corallincola]MBV2353918.1 hypothetical protein [Streptomyces corallincola]
MTAGLLALPVQAHAAASDGLTRAQAQTLIDEFEARPVPPTSPAARLQKRLAEDGDPADVIDPADYRCDTNTPVRNWLADSRADWTASDQSAGDLFLQVVLLDSVLFPDAHSKDFGPHGEFTKAVNKSFTGLGRFWDIDPSRISVVAMHSDVLRDPAGIARVFEEAFGVEESAALQFGEALATIADQDKFDHGDHPYFTFNAFAINGLDLGDGRSIPPEIIMGDGVLQGFKAVGLDDVAPASIVAHEYGHHVQYQRDLFDSPLTGPEASRRTELMADSFAGYYLTHVRGAHLGWNRVRDFQKVFFQLGDCSFAAASHHGTPEQRLHAAQYGFTLAELAFPRGQVMPTTKFAAKFERVLPLLVAPNA